MFFANSNAQELYKRIIEKAWTDDNFKNKLLADPKAALKDSFNITPPTDFSLEVLVETENKKYLIIPLKTTFEMDIPSEGW